MQYLLGAIVCNLYVACCAATMHETQKNRLVKIIKWKYYNYYYCTCTTVAMMVVVVCFTTKVN